jgi:hypothetical protein
MYAAQSAQKILPTQKPFFYYLFSKIYLPPSKPKPPIQEKFIKFNVA